MVEGITTPNILIALGVLALVFPAPSISADTLYVDRLDDDPTATACFLGTPGDCSLRGAIIRANGTPGFDVLYLIVDGTYQLTVPGSGGAEVGDLDVSGDVVIHGQGTGQTIINASGIPGGDRVFDVLPAASLVMDSLTVTGGNEPFGGGIYSSSATVWLSDVAVVDNQGTHGGGIYVNLGELTILDGSRISGNQITQHGGGIFGASATLTVTDSAITGNTSDQRGGGLCVLDGDTSITSSTISGNQSGWSGGGISVAKSSDDTATVELVNCTLHGNSATSSGGAIDNVGGHVSLNAVTFSDNHCPTDGSAIQAIGGAVLLVNSLISGTQGIPTCSLHGTGYSYGGNLEGPGNTCGFTGLDQVNIADAMLGPLGDYGGPTQTLLPLQGSPAIGHGSNDYCLDVDQRGVPRSDGFCDVGAVERLPGDTVPLFFDGFESGDFSSWSASSP